MQHEHEHPDTGNRPRTVSRFVFFGFLAVAAYFLITEHRAHLFGVLPFLLFAACPLMHLFHHREHGGHKHGDGEKPSGTNGP
jgi:Protein of unknown function (DUF2933)